MDKGRSVRVRFAPSPTGYLHVGNARTALFNWLFARQNKGTFVLRIEDTDVERSTEIYEKKILEDLDWLGLSWDEGPDVGGAYGPYRQSERLGIYTGFTDRLISRGQAYYCFCSKESLEAEKKKDLARGKNPVYSGKCRALDMGSSIERIGKGEKAAVRLKTPGKGEVSFDDLVRGRVRFDLSLLGDPVLVRASGLPAYNYAVVIDDAEMKISHVIRGEDHLSNMPRQILLYRALSLPSPRFAHLSMVMGSDNTRLSKRHGATSIDQFERAGILPAALDNYLALLGWAPQDGREIMQIDELVKSFDLNKVSKSSAIFDYTKLNWLNRQHVKTLPPDRQAALAYPHLAAGGFLPEVMTDAHWSWLKNAVAVLVEKVDMFSELGDHFLAFFRFSPKDLDEEGKEILKTECAEKVLAAASKKLEALDTLDFERFALLTKEIKSDTGCKGKDLFHPLRVALTTKTSGLDLDKFIPLVEEGASLVFPLELKTCAQRIHEVLLWMKSAGKSAEPDE